MLLALDTSAAVSAAVLDDDEGSVDVLAERTRHDPRRHAELLVPSIDEVLREAGRTRADVSRIGVGVGPGPFTGLRVGLVTARTLGLALGVPVDGVCSLDALALQALEALEDGEHELVVATDARRREVYWARYAARPVGGVPVRLRGPEVSRPADVPVGGAVCVGRGGVLYPDALPTPEQEGLPLDPQAGALGRVAAVRLRAGGEGLEPPDPMYLRRPDAAPPAERKRVLQ
ncbi:MAG: tRNA (adenosine(37)-N6)-threonylcarbamoyltransferase complex dimerization subunit type 1 TsaB [Actinomycetes bacterium]